jgi:hypothetical protein
MSLEIVLQIVEIGIITYIAVIDRELLKKEIANGEHLKEYWKLRNQWRLERRQSRAKKQTEGTVSSTDSNPPSIGSNDKEEIPKV